MSRRIILEAAVNFSPSSALPITCAPRQRKIYGHEKLSLTPTRPEAQRCRSPAPPRVAGRPLSGAGRLPSGLLVVRFTRVPGSPAQTFQPSALKRARRAGLRISRRQPAAGPGQAGACKAEAAIPRARSEAGEYNHVLASHDV